MAQDCVSIGAGTSKNNNLPICSYYYGSYTQQLFLASELELNGAVNITSVAFQYDYTNSTKRKISIYMANTEATSLSSAYVTDGFEEVLSATEVIFDNSADWFTIDLETPFAYDGTSNLVVAVYMDYLSTQTEYNSNSRFRYTSATGMARYTTNDNAAAGDLTVVNGVLTANNYSSGINGTSSSSRANMQFCYTTGSVGPTCDKPTDLDFTGVGSKTATLNWAGGSGTYDVEYQVKGDSVWAFAVKNSTATSVTLNNLVPYTTYSVRVKSKCDGGAESGYKTGSFTTLIGIPYADQLATQGDWTKRQGLVNDVLNGTALSGTGSWNFGARYGVLGGNHAYRNVWGTTCKDWIISPVIPLEENCQLSFSLALTDNANADPIEDFNAQQDDRFVVLVSLDSMATWSILREWNNKNSEFKYNQIATEGEDVEIDLSAYGGVNVQIAFYCESTASGGDNDIHVGNVLIDYAPSCLKPTSLHEVEGGVSKNAIQVAWEHAGAQLYKVQYKKVSEDTWTTADATDTTYNITGLDQFTEYNIRVAAFCDITDSTTLTDYCKQIIVKTATGVPFEQNFNVSALPSEWKRYDTKLSLVQTGAALDGTAEGWKAVAKAQANNIFDSAYHVVLNLADTMNYWLVSPTIEMIAGQQLTFDLALTTKDGGAVTAGAQPDDVFEVLVYADGEWNELGIWANGGEGTQFDAISSSSNGQTIKFDMDAYAGKNIRLAFYGESSASNGDNNLHIANLKIDVKPSCTPAMSLSIEDLDVTTATVKWTTDEPGSVWQYGMIANPAANFAPADEDFVNDTTALSISLTGLAGETTYAFFLRHACGNGYSEPIVRTFKTYPAPKTVPWTENFEAYDANTIAPYWDNSASASTTISGTNPHYIWGVYSYSSNKMIRMYNSLVQKGTALINTPRIDLAPENGCMLSFDYSHAASCDPFSVRISTDNGKSWTELASYGKTASSNESSNPGTFTKAEINLAAYAGQIVMLQFYSLANYGSGAIFVDNIKIDLLPDCLKPTNLVVSNVTANGATFSWDNEENAAWEYVCVPDSITELPAYTACAQNSLLLDNLDEKTDYVFYLRRVCGENSVSDSIFATFKTLPEPKTMPWAENFSGLASGAIPEDWDNSEGTTTTASYKWVYYASNGDTCLRFNSFSNTSGKTSILVTPPILLSEAAMLSFRWKNPTGGAGEIFISNDGGDTRTSLKNNLTGVANWSTYEIDLSDYTNDIVNIYFKGTSNYGNGDAYLYLDDVEIKALPTCFKPDSLVVDTFTTNSIKIDWAPVGNETHWLVQYKKSSESAWSQVTDSILAHPYTLVNLDPSTVYDIRVAAWCNADDASEFCNPISWATECAPVTEFPYKEGFDSIAGTTGSGTSGVHVLPLCWDYINTCTSSSYDYYPTVYKSSTYANTPNNSLKFYSYYTTSISYTAEDQYAILPEMDALNTMRLKLNARANSTGTTYDATFYVGIMSDPTDTATFVVMDTIQPTSTTYAPYVIPFNEYTGTGKHIAIKMEAADGTIGTSSSHYRSVYIDDIVVEEIPNCLEPANLVVLDTLTTMNSAVFTWTVQGEETAWVFQYKKLADEEWTSVVAANDTFTLEGLESATMYVARVAAQCSETETSRYTDQITFVTSCGAWSIAEHNYTEGFEAYEGAAFNATNGVVPVCWDAVSSGDVAPHVIAPTDQYAYVHGGEKALTFYGNGYCYAALPVFAEPLNTLRISFWAGMESLSYGELTLGYITNESNIFHPIETYESSLKTDMKQHITDLMAVPDSAARLVFEWYYSSQWSCCIDDIEVMPLPNCFEPKGLDVKLTRGNGSVATLNWQDTVATSWVVEYSLHADMSDAISVVANDTTLELTGLMSDSTYYARVKSICGENEESAWTNAISFVPTSAIIINDGTTTSSYVPFYGSYVSSATESQFIIPEKEIELIKWDSITQLTFYSSSTYKNQSWTGSKFEVYVAETTDSVLTSMLDWTDMTKVMNAKHLELVDQQMVVNLDKPFQYQGGNIVIGFKLTTTGTSGYCYWYGKSGVSGNAMYKYSTSATKSTFNPKMRIAHVPGVVPTCLVVKNVEASEFTASSAKLSWTNGEETQNAWQIAYSCDPAFDLASVTAEQIVDVATNPYVLTGLLPDTLYNVYVRANCSEAENEDYSLWSKLCTFTTASACQTPTDLAVADITDASASISWNTYGQTGFNLRYSTNGTLWLDTIENITVAPYVLNNLSANEHYYVQVQNDCNVEAWSESIQFKTACVAWSIALDGEYTEDFESYTGTAYSAVGVAPDCWDVAIGKNATVLPHIVDKTVNSSYAYVHSGTKALSFHGKDNCYAALPVFAEALNGLQIGFWMQTESATYGELTLGYITASDPGDFSTFQPYVTYENNNGSMIYRETVLDTIPAEAYRLVFRWYYTGQWSCCIDDINVSFIPTCIKPENVTASDIAGHSAKISWTLGEAGQTAWQIAYDTIASKQPDTLANVIDVIDSVYQITGLYPQKKYYVYVRANCGEQDGMSKWSDGIYFTTTIACPAPTGFKATLTPGNGSIAKLTWTAGDAQAWQVEYSLNSNMTDSIVLNVTEAQANLTGLTAEATYYARVKADCGELDGESAYSAVISFIPTNKYELIVNDNATASYSYSYVPIQGSYVDEGNTASQFIIPAASLETLEWDSIKAMTFYSSTDNSTWGASEWEIYMTEVKDETLAALADWNTMTQVMTSGSLALVNGKMVVTLTDPYYYQGGNLLIGFKQTVASGGDYSSATWYGATATGASIGGHGTSVAQRNYLPKINFEYVPGVVPACPNPKYLAISEITANSAVASWKAVEGATWEYALVAGEAEPTEYIQTTENEIALSNLDDATDYVFYLRRACGENTYSDVLSVEFTTDAFVATLPFVENFEGENHWKLINGTEPNAWVINEQLFISNDGGVNNQYTNSVASRTFATILINFEETGTYTFAYDWQANGDYDLDEGEAYDYLRVALVPENAEITAGMASLPAGHIALDNGGLYGVTTWQRLVKDDVEVTPGLWKLLVAWFNDDSDGDQTPAAIDNISIKHKAYPTDIEAGAGIESKAVKFIYNDQVYILLNGAVYNITGQKVELK